MELGAHTFIRAIDRALTLASGLLTGIQLLGSLVS